MLLAIDVGNTNAVLGIFGHGQGANLVRTWRVSTHPLCTADEFRANLHTLFAMEGMSLGEVSAVALSSVVPQFTQMLRYAFPATQLHVIDHTWPFSFSIKASPANQIGMDRLVNAETVVREHGGPAIVVDSGTATTLCAISKNREYLGGAIMPGLELSMQTLAKNTAQLFSVELTAPDHAIGPNTLQALRSGIVLGYASMLDGMIRRFKQELGATQGQNDAKVVATGGVSLLLRGIATEFTHIDQDLTLKGIHSLYESFHAIP